MAGSLFESPADSPADSPEKATKKLVIRLVLAGVGLVAGMGVFGACLGSLQQARMSGNEASAIGSMRIIVSGQATYASSCAVGFYAPTLEALGRAPRGATGAMGFIGSEMAGPEPVIKSGYEIRMSAVPAAESPESCNGVPAGQSAKTFTATATPQPNAGARHFAVTAEGVVWESPQAIAFGADSKPLPPAKELR